MAKESGKRKRNGTPNKRKRKENEIQIKIVDEERIMRTAIALKKVTLDSTDYIRIALQLRIPQSEVEKVVKKLHPAVRVQGM